MGILQAWYCIFSVGNQFCLSSSQLKCYWAVLLPGVVTSPSGQIGLENTVYSELSCDSVPCLKGGKQDSRASKALHLSIQIRKIYTLTSSLGRSLSSADEQIFQVGLLLGHCKYELSMPMPTCWLLPAPSLFFVTVRFSVAEPPDSSTIPMVQDQNKDAHKATPIRDWLYPRSFLFPLEKLKAQGRPLQVVLC